MKILAAVTLIAATTLCAQTPTERLTAMTKSTGLANVTGKPWHLKADVTVFDDAGKNPSPGTLEIWHSDYGMRVTYNFGATTVTELKVGPDTHSSSTGPELPHRAIEVFDQLMHPGPSTEEIAESTVELEKHNFGKVSFDCIYLAQPIADRKPVPLGLFPTYCLQADNVLRTSYDYATRSVLINGAGKFLDVSIPTQLSIVDDSKTVATAKVTALGTYVPDQAQFEPTHDMESLQYLRIGGGVAAKSVISKVQPIYPPDARQHHITGTVILHGTIGRDGHVHNLRVASAPDPQLALAALQCVRYWTYKPYLLNDRPTEIDTTFSIGFGIGEIHETGIRH